MSDEVLRDVLEKDSLQELPEPVKDVNKAEDKHPRPPGWKRVMKALFPLSLALMVSVSSTVGTQVIKNMYTGSFNAVFFATWFSVCFTMLLFPAFLVLHRMSRHRTPQNLADIIKAVGRVYDEAPPSTVSSGPGAKLVKYFLVNTGFTAMYVGANYLYIKALQFIQPSLNSGVFSASNAFIFLLSVFILKDRAYLLKGVSVALAVPGVILIAGVTDLSSVKTLGVVLSLCAAVVASFYKVLFKKLVGSGGSLAVVTFFLSSIGLMNLVFGPLVVYILHFSGREVLPPIREIPWPYIVGKSCSALVFDLLVNFGIALTSPLFITIGSLFAYPLNLMVDLVYRKQTHSPSSGIGVLLILLSFVIILVPEDKMLRVQRRFEESYKESVSRIKKSARSSGTQHQT